VIEVVPTVNADGSDAGGAKCFITSDKVELRRVRSGAFFVRGSDDAAPFRDAAQFMSSVARGIEALTRFQDRRQHAHEMLEQQWCQPLVEAAGVIEFASYLDADAIVVGRRGRGGFTELVPGSFSGPRARADADGP
jgi:nucleotide-binding universal stress UspA family protein